VSILAWLIWNIVFLIWFTVWAFYNASQHNLLGVLINVGLASLYAFLTRYQWGRWREQRRNQRESS
jgi:hypothetical protein